MYKIMSLAKSALEAALICVVVICGAPFFIAGLIFAVGTESFLIGKTIGEKKL